MRQQKSTKAAPRFTQIVLVGERHFLEYNKTAIMHKIFQSLPLTYRFVDISSDSKSRIWRKLNYIISYFKLLCSLGQAQRGEILWLSEFKFSLAHALCAKLIAKLHGMILIGGPHTLAADSVLLTDPSYQRRNFLLSQKLKLYLLNRIDGLIVSTFDVVQSYTTLYAERAKKLARHSNKPTIVFPIGHSLDRQPTTWEPSFKKTGQLRVVFWGIANALHGLDVLPPAVDYLRNLGINVKVYIFASANYFVTSTFLEVKRRKLEDQFVLDSYTWVKNDYSKVLFADLAISHLVSPAIHKSARQLMNAISTPNKLYEILGLGMPALVAKTDAVIDAIGLDSSVYVEQGDSNSLTQVLQSVYQDEIDLREIAKRGQFISHTQYSLQSSANNVAMQLDQLPIP